MKKQYSFLLLLFITIFMASVLAQQTVLEPTASFLGTRVSERIAYWVNTAGDVNGDGYDDFLMGGCHSGRNGSESGTAYLILGRQGADWGRNYDLDYADGIFVGNYGYYAGYAIAGGGDVNGDGLDDFIIGSCGRPGYVPKSYSGRAFLIFGRNSADWGQNFILKDSTDVIFLGEGGEDQAGVGVSMIGDLNNDGFDDFIIGAPLNDFGNTNSGKVYLLLGKGSGWQHNISLADADASFVSRMEGHNVGYCVSGLGDVNGDGVSDFIIGAYHDKNEIYLIFGRVNVDWGQNYDLANADVIFKGERTGDGSGLLVSNAGDVNGDGLNDILIGADKAHNSMGKAYLILGKAGSWSQRVYLSGADASFIGEALKDKVGTMKSIAGGGDFNDDGYDDILIGAPFNDEFKNNAGKFYIIYGKPSGWARDVSLKYTDSYFLGEDTTSFTGDAINFVGDIDGDSRDDVVVSAPYNSKARKYAGQMYLFLGEGDYYRISGKVFYSWNGSPVENVSMNLVHENPLSTDTDQNGHYQFQVLRNSSFSITASKPIDEDVNSNMVTSYDAAIAARCAVGLETLNSSQKLAADVDKNGNVEMFDAALICRYVVGLPRISSSHVGEWVFIPESMVFENLGSDLYNQDYESVVLGDVQVGGASKNLNRMTEYEKLLEKIRIVKGDIVKIQLPIESHNEMISGDVSFRYNSEMLQLTEIKKTELTRDFHLMYNECNKGYVKVGLFGTQPIHESGYILDLVFQIVDSLGNQSEFFLERYQINGGISCTSHIPIRLTDTVNKPHRFLLMQNFPNPFNSETVIAYSVSETQRVRIAIFDLLGVCVKILVNEIKVPGNYNSKWDGRDSGGQDVASGIYFCRASMGNQVLQMKLIKLN